MCKYTIMPAFHVKQLKAKMIVAWVGGIPTKETRLPKALPCERTLPPQHSPINLKESSPESNSFIEIHGQ